ncbi:MAG: glycosyltransferase family 2 protein [Microthrixaceae bacterium]
MSLPRLGVVVLCYASADVIGECLDSLCASRGVDLDVVVCDNASPDTTLQVLERWAEQHAVDVAEFDARSTELETHHTPGGLTLIRSSRNLGFAGGVNIGLRALLSRSDIDLFWILNPDAVVQPGTAAAFVEEASNGPAFSLMGGRTLYMEAPQLIQSDGGRVGRWSGMCRNVNQGYDPSGAVAPDPSTLDFVSGANMVVSRTFLETVGLMEEDYFLYYEEVDWAFRRGDLPLLVCPDAVVEHHGGTAIGTGSVNRRPSAFANYYNYRNRMRFMRRFIPTGLVTSYVYSMLKVLQLVLYGAWREAMGALRGLHNLSPLDRSENQPSGGGVGV